MKLLVISATFPPMRSGGADYAYRLCQRLAAEGLEIYVLTSSIDNVATDPRVRVYPVMRRWSWAEMPRLLRVALRCRPDVVHLHFTGPIYNDQPMVTFAPTILKKLIPHIRIVTQIESLDGVRVWRLPIATRAVRKAITHLVGAQEVDYGYGTILRDSDRIIVSSDAHRMILSKFLPKVEGKCVLIPPPPIMPVCTEANGSARRRGRESLRLRPDEFVIAYYGYLYPGKGVETLMQAFRLVSRNTAKVRLLMIGGSNEVVLKTVNRPYYAEELAEFSAQLDVADKIIWTGYYPYDSDQPSLYLRGADACVLPFDDGVMLFRSSVAAAAAHGLPIITTKGEIVESPFIDNENVLLCDPKDPEALAVSIESLISNPELKHRLQKGALELARDWFSWDKVIERTMGAFNCIE